MRDISKYVAALEELAWTLAKIRDSALDMDDRHHASAMGTIDAINAIRMAALVEAKRRQSEDYPAKTNLPTWITDAQGQDNR